MKSFVTVSCALAALVSPLVATDDKRAKQTEVVPTTLDRIRATPESFKGVTVSFDVQFASIGRLQNPFFTQFVASDYANFYVWADAQEIWRRAEYDNVFGLMFMSKANDLLEDLFELRVYDRLQVKAVVRNTFQGKPWIEVHSFTPLEGKVSTAALTHLFRGEQHMDKHEWSQAVSELSLAPAAGVPDPLLASVHKNIGVCYLRMGEQEMALTHLHEAQSLQNSDELESLILTANARPDTALDRAVNREALRDFERPLWEAFEDGAAAVPGMPISPLQ